VRIWRIVRWPLVAVAGIAFGAFLLPSRAIVVHGADGRPTWADVTTAVATIVLATVTATAAVVAYIEYRRGLAEAKELAVSRCDADVRATCFEYKGYHLVRVDVRVTNRSTARLDISTDYPAFVFVRPVSDRALSRALKDSTTDLGPIVARSTVLNGQFLESTETLLDSCLLPIHPRHDISAYRVEFGLRVEGDDEYYDWSAVTYVPVKMTPSAVECVS
jgi:hypothetical protein